MGVCAHDCPSATVAAADRQPRRRSVAGASVYYLNYEIHGNSIPHLHLHLFPRFAGDPYVGGPIDPAKAVFTRSDEELECLGRALRPT